MSHKHRPEERPPEEIPDSITLPGGAGFRASGSRYTPLKRVDDPYDDPEPELTMEEALELDRQKLIALGMDPGPTAEELGL